MEAGHLIGAVLLALIAVLVWDDLSQRRRIGSLASKFAETEQRLRKYESLVPRAANLAFQEMLHEERLQRDVWEESSAFGEELFAVDNRFPHGHNTSVWQTHLKQTTAQAFENEEHGLESTPAFCSGQPDLSTIVISEKELHTANGSLSHETRRRAHRALTECGYVYLDNMFSHATVERLRDAYFALRDSTEGKEMLYPCQGTGRIEHMLPFRPPFNESDAVYADPRLLTLLGDFLHEQFKLELMTVITSPPGAKDQRWHQGWRYLFHPDERLPPYAVVVALPLADVSHEMGPTEMCPGKRLRFYHGWRCEQHSIKLGSSLGTVAIFDYKTLHRGPANTASTERPMVSMVFSKMFFVNTEAIVNQGVPLAQTLHQRRYWEQFQWHPPSLEEKFAV